MTYKWKYNFRNFPVEIFVINLAYKTKNNKLTLFKQYYFLRFTCFINYTNFSNFQISKI